MQLILKYIGEKKSIWKKKMKNRKRERDVNKPFRLSNTYQERT